MAKLLPKVVCTALSQMQQEAKTVCECMHHKSIELTNFVCMIAMHYVDASHVAMSYQIQALDSVGALNQGIP